LSEIKPSLKEFDFEYRPSDNDQLELNFEEEDE
jgi:hypothetical protein